jgi:pilus assembly protein CpaC
MRRILLVVFILVCFISNLLAVPMIEVSVDIIEIKQNKNDTQGVTWNETLNFEEGLSSPTYFNFANTTTKVPMPSDYANPRGVASNFTIGSFERFSPLAATLRLMITDNKARLLANPKLATESGSQASFVVGGEIPVPVVSPQGTSIEWKNLWN